jgi:hypothetical protein
MQTKKNMMAGVTGVMLIAVGSLPASAQYSPYESCGDIYNRTLSIYHAYGPHSPQYAQILGYYNARCMGGSLAPPVYTYAPPAPFDPGAAIVGGIIGGVVGSALAGGDRDTRSDRRHHRRDDRRHHHRDDRRDDGSHRGDWRR